MGNGKRYFFPFPISHFQSIFFVLSLFSPASSSDLTSSRGEERGTIALVGRQNSRIAICQFDS
jgi:hypothetical protein